MAPRRPRQPLELMTELVEEILLRVPPDAPACLARAALVCKPWRRLLSDHAFRRRYRTFHRAPPLLGFLHKYYTSGARNLPLFVPTVTPSPFPQRAFHDFAGSCVLDCRHGRVLFDVAVEGVNLVVWDPVTGKRYGLPEPPIRRQAYNAAVLCGVRGCDHLDCHGGPFFVVLVGYGNRAFGSHLYSSEAGAWNASADLGSPHFAKRKPSALIGDDVYFVLAPSDMILKYNLGKNCLSTIHPPDVQGTIGDMFLVPMEDGSLGLALMLCSSISLWSRNADPEVVAGWVQFRVIDLLTPTIPFWNIVHVAGSTEGFGIIFVVADDGVFAMELKSGNVRKVCEPREHLTIFPFMSFFTPDYASSVLSSSAEAH